MEQDADKFQGFSEPKSNYTRVPNAFFDKLLRILTSAEVIMLLFIFRKTWGWGKMFDQLAESQFIKATGLSKNTVRKALNSLENRRCILRYVIGKGRTRKTYFFLYTAKSYQIVQALKSGQLNIQQAQLLNTTDSKIGSEIGPNNGSEIDPISQGSNRPNFDPTERKGFKNTL